MAQPTSIGPHVIHGLNSVGVMVDWPHATPPIGWLNANGANVSRLIYADLFAIFGTAFGVGDGSTTFALPTGSPPAGCITIIKYSNLGVA